MNNSETSEFASWLTSVGLAVYEDNFNHHGYNDLDLLKMMNDEEENQMFQILGITLHGHVLKLKKCIQGLRSAAAGPSTRQDQTQSNSIKPTPSKQGSKCFTFTSFSMHNVNVSM